MLSNNVHFSIKTMSRNNSRQQSCYAAYFRDNFTSWFIYNYPKFDIKKTDIHNLAKKMWDNMVEEKEKSKDKCVKFGDSSLRFSTTTTINEKSGASHIERFSQEKERVMDYVRLNGPQFVENYMQALNPQVKKGDGRDRKLELWKSKVTQLDEDDFDEISNYDDEEILLKQIQSKYVECFQSGEINGFSELVDYIKNQSLSIEKSISDLSHSIIIQQQLLSDLSKKRLFLTEGVRKAEILQNKLLLSSNIKKPKTIAEFDPDDDIFW